MEYHCEQDQNRRSPGDSGPCDIALLRPYNRSVRCLSCQYDLKALSGHRCPECGRAFDPNNPETFDLLESNARTRNRIYKLVALSALPLMIAVMHFFNGWSLQDDACCGSVLWLLFILIAFQLTGGELER